MYGTKHEGLRAEKAELIERRSCKEELMDVRDTGSAEMGKGGKGVYRSTAAGYKGIELGSKFVEASRSGLLFVACLPKKRLLKAL